jgi:hypothetical protein
VSAWTDVPHDPEPDRLDIAAGCLFLAPAVCAQPGPAPGSDPATYAQDYYGGQVANASADPAGYAASQASVASLQNQTREAAYIACWAAYDATGMLTDPVCAAYFTSPERAARRQKEQNTTAEDAAAALNQTLDGAVGMANTTLDAVNDTLADPASAPSQLQRIADAVVAFVTGTATLVIDTVGEAIGGAVDLVLGIAGGLLDGLGLGAKGASMAAGAVGDLLGAALAGLAQGSSAAASGVGALLAATTDAATGAAHAVAGAAGAAVDGVAGAGRAVADAAASATQAVANAVGSAVDAVAHLFGHGATSKGLPGTSGKGLAKDLPTDDLLGTVRKAVPL